MTLDPLVVIGAIGSLAGTVIAAGLSRKWVWGYQLVDMTKDRDFWRDVALTSMGDVAALTRKKTPSA